MSYRSTGWQDAARCAPHLNFTDWPINEQLTLCRDCPVTTECVALGLASVATAKDAANGPVYGGLRPIQLAALVRQRNTAGRAK
jgi:hypothetical protein